MKKHRNHHHIHAVPVGVPTNLLDPFPEVKIKPDPDTDTEVGQRDEEGAYVDDKEDVLKLLNPRIDCVDIIISNRIIAHYSSINLLLFLTQISILYYTLLLFMVPGVPIHTLLNGLLS